MRHVHTYRHVVEVRVVSQEVYEGDQLVDGLNSVWQVSNSFSWYSDVGVHIHAKLLHV